VTTIDYLKMTITYIDDGEKCSVQMESEGVEEEEIVPLLKKLGLLEMAKSLIIRGMDEVNE